MNNKTKHFGNLDLQKNTLENVAIDQRTSSQLTSLATGQLFIKDSDTSNLYMYDGSSIIKVGSKLRISDLSPAGASVDLGSNKIINVSLPTFSTDVASKAYVDGVAFGNIDPFDLANAYISWEDDVNVYDDEVTLEENLDSVDLGLSVIIPRPEKLSEANLETNITRYPAILPLDLPSNWYDYKSAGDTINTYVTSSNFYGTIKFLSGLYDKIPTYGNLSVRINDSDMSNIISFKQGETYTNYVTADLEANVKIDEYFKKSNFWNQANANVVIQINSEGHSNIQLTSTKSGVSRDFKFHYDDTAPNPVFSSVPTHTVQNTVYKYLSNIEYYTLDSVFFISFETGAGIFEKSYHPTAVANVYVNGGAVNNINLNPTSVPNYYDSFVISNANVIIDVSNKTSGLENGRIYVRLQKPDGKISVGSTVLNRMINTYGNVATVNREYFLDESYRLLANTETAWNSQTSFDSSNAAVDAQVRNGYLMYPVAADYGSPYTPTGVKQYERRFYPGNPISSGYLEFGGIKLPDISRYGIGSVNVILELTDQGKFFDLGRDTSDGDGNSFANAYPGRELEINQNVLNFSFLTHSTGLESTNSYKIIIFLRDNTKSLSYVYHYNNYTTDVDDNIEDSPQEDIRPVFIHGSYLASSLTSNAISLSSNTYVTINMDTNVSSNVVDYSTMDANVEYKFELFANGSSRNITFNPGDLSNSSNITIPQSNTLIMDMWLKNNKAYWISVDTIRNI